MATKSNKLEVNAISVWRGDNLLLNDVSFTLNPGDVLQVQGANGSGKTTLLRIVCGLGLADEGQVSWCGDSIEKNRDQFHEDLLYLGHKPGIKPALSAIENLRIFTLLDGQAATANTDTDIAQALDELSLLSKAHLPCRALSAGQQRRVALARLVLQSAKLWVLDEPLTSLDKDGLALVEQRMATHVHNGGSILLTTHAPISIDGVKVATLEL